MKSTGMYIRRQLHGKLVDFFLYEEGKYLTVYLGSIHSPGSALVGWASSYDTARAMVDDYIFFAHKE